MTTTIINSHSNGMILKPKSYKTKKNPSFTGLSNTIITNARDKKILEVFSQHYGNIGNRLSSELSNLTSESEFLKQSSRFSHKEDGALVITDKKIPRSVLENIVFPFVTLPLQGINALLKKLQDVPFFEKTAKFLYDSSLLKLQRGLNSLDSDTDVLKGMFEKTEKTISDFAKEKNLKTDDLLDMLVNPNNHSDKKELIKEADDYIKESLYKVSNKFFDKNTGNFNTAHERPLNRIVSGLIPVGFLANDAYNLSVLCGDKKEDSEKEADDRKKQEIIRVFTTAYIQLLIFGAFTKQVNTISWFAPVTSAATVLISEIFARKKLDRPIFFLSKEDAQEYNKTHGHENILLAKNHFGNNLNNLNNNNNDKNNNNVFKGFDNSINFKKTKKDKKPNALMNFQTFEKGVMGLTGAFLTLNFLKNSSYTKNSFLVKGFNNLCKYLNDNVYKPLAFKNFEISEDKFNSIMSSLRDIGADNIAKGHEFIKKNHAETSSDGLIKIYKHSIKTSEVKNIASSVFSEAEKNSFSFNNEQKEIVEQAITTSINQGKSDIAEKKYNKIAQKALDIIRKKNIILNEDQISKLQATIIEELKNKSSKTEIQVATKLKPFVDVVTAPFEFIYSAARLPFKYIVKPAVNLLVSPIEKKAQKALLGEAELTSFEKNVHNIVTEIFGEKEAKKGKISQMIFANAMEQLEKKTLPYRLAKQELEQAIKNKAPQSEIDRLSNLKNKEQEILTNYINTSVEKSFNGVTQSSNKNTDLALMSKLASSTVTSAFLVADNYNMVMLKSNGEETDEAKEKANERIIQRLSGLFYQAMFINWFNQTFTSTYNSSLLGMTSVVIPNTLTTEILMRKSIGMPVTRQTLDELNEMDRENENRKGILGKYFEFMRLLTGKKPLKDRLPKEKQAELDNNIKLNYTNLGLDKSNTNIFDSLIMNK